MSRIDVVKTEVFKFDELSKDAKQEAIERLYDINIDHDWWDLTCENAKNIGIDIQEFDIDCGNRCRIKLLNSFKAVLNSILYEYSESCEIHRTACRYTQEYDKILIKELKESVDNDESSTDADYENLEEDFIRSISEDYLLVLRNEYEYLTSKEAIIETIDTNEYEFTIDGKLYPNREGV